MLDVIVTCECQSGKRLVEIDFREIPLALVLLRDFSENNHWKLCQESKSLRVGIGPDTSFATLHELVNFLRVVVGENAMQRLSAAWIPQCGSTPGGCSTLPAQPLLAMAPQDATPLAALLTAGRLRTHFQPIFDARRGGVWGYECLMRADDGHGGALSPAQLLAWAAQERLTFMLDRVCRKTHIRNAAVLPESCRILINFLPTAIYEPGFCLRTTEAAVKQSRIRPERIIFEIVETEEVADRDRLNHIIDHYRRGGYGVALDDVGAGYSGLMMLADLNPDLIKIDRELVVKAAHSKMHRVICHALVRMARDSGKLCLAEGIQTAEEQQVMDRLGVDLYQGFRFGRPAADPLPDGSVSEYIVPDKMPTHTANAA